MKGRAFTILGALLILVSLYLSYIELWSALQGSAEAWMGLSALICAGVLGVGMVRVGRSTPNGDDSPGAGTY